MRGATLFSGIGAPETSCPEVDWRWAAEIDPFASAVYAARYPGVVNHGDVERIDAAAVEPVRLVVFGSPCQSFSVAGKRLGLDDPRGNLALVGLRLVGQVRPDWVVFENVLGLLSSDGGRDFGIFLGLLGELGYGFAYRVLDAQHAGVPQRRRRVFVVGRLGDWRAAAAVLLESESLLWHPPPRREAGQGVAASLTRGADSGGRGGYAGRRQEDDVNLVAPPITSGPIDVATACSAHGGPHGRLDFESETFVAHALRADGFDASEDGTGRGTPLVTAVRTAQTSANGHGVAEDVAHTLDRASGQALAINLRGREGGSQLESADSASLRSPSGGSSRSYVQAASVRRLTPTECERLQGFPDGFTDITYRGRPAADGPRYRALGNSMAVPVIGWVLRRVLQVDKLL